VSRRGTHPAAPATGLQACSVRQIRLSGHSARPFASLPPGAARPSRVTCSGLVEFCTLDHYRLRLDRRCRLLFAQRTATPFAGISDIRRCFSQIEAKLGEIPRRHYALLVDARGGPSRNDRGFELVPEEDCIDAPGMRRLLRFSVETPNVGDADLILGRPSDDNPVFAWSDCHQHYHYLGFAEYELLDGDGKLATAGRKQAFCLVDTNRYDTADPTVSDDGVYTCTNQGVQRGWSDVYDSATACQHIDVTDVPDGAYTLRIAINSLHTLPESRYDNNAIELPVTLGDPALATPAEPCPPVDAYSLSGATRECGWQLFGAVPCEPDRIVRIGCATACGLGACTGDPMLRVCESDRPDGNCSHAASLGRSTGACGSSCPVVSSVRCPGNGSVDVFMAPRIPGAAYTCDLEIEQL